MAAASGGDRKQRQGPIRRLVLATAPAQAIARLLELVCYGLVIAALGAMCWAIFALAGVSGADTLTTTGMIALAIAAGGVTVSLFGRLAELYGQRARDIEADRIFHAAQAGRRT